MSNRAPKALAVRVRRASQPSTPSRAAATEAMTTAFPAFTTRSGISIAARSAVSRARMPVTQSAGPKTTIR